MAGDIKNRTAYPPVARQGFGAVGRAGTRAENGALADGTAVPPASTNHRRYARGFSRISYVAMTSSTLMSLKFPRLIPPS